MYKNCSQQGKPGETREQTGWDRSQGLKSTYVEEVVDSEVFCLAGLSLLEDSFFASLFESVLVVALDALPSSEGVPLRA